MRAFWSLTFGIAVLAAAPRARAVNPAWPNHSATRDQLALPENWPDDPGYGYVQPGTCPSGPLAGQTVLRPTGGQWNLWGFYPPDTVDPCGDPTVDGWALGKTLNATERATMNGTGMSVDVAWTMTTGDPRVLIAVHDCGAEWDRADLVNKWYLNEGELPLPQHADGTVCPGYDCNGDGVFNVLDFTSGRGHDQPVIAIITDPRIYNYQCAGNPNCHGDTNGNGLLDPGDLITIFSDGKDDDGNGFVDDICGWDFFWGDNNPSDDVRYGHGTGEAADSAAEANNGIDEAGSCPDCRVMPVRVGDSFVADSNHFAEGVFFSLSHGANVIQQALGALNDTPLMQRAIDAAYAQGAIIISSAADEDSLHHNYPGNAEHTQLVHAITHDNSPQNATSFLDYNDCSNGGGHLALSTPGDSCSSEATGKSSGQAGLIYSAWLQYHPNDAPLTAAEVMQLMVTTSEDIDVPGSATDPNLRPSGPGWDLWFGWGRNDTGASVAAVKNGQIPPEVDVTSPRWFETVDPVQTPTLAITGRVAANRAASYDFVVQVAPGIVPQPTDFKTAATVTGATSPTDGTLATFALAGLFANPAAVSSDPQANAVTVVVTAVAHYGGAIGDVSGEFRKTFFVHQDPDLFAGFPIYLGSGGDSNAHLVNLDGSGHDSIVMATDDGRVHALQADGSELPGWPVQTTPLPDVLAHPDLPAYGPTGPTQGTAQAFGQSVAVGSLNGDGKLQVVAGTLDGQVYAWNADGSLVMGFPVQSDPAHYLDGTHDYTTDAGISVTYILTKGFFAAPVLYDLDGTGKLAIISAGEDGWLYVWDATGTPRPGFPLEVYDPNGGAADGDKTLQHTRMMSTPAVGDLNGDGHPAIVVGTNEVYGSEGGRMYAIWADGNNHAGGPYLPGWPIDPKGLDHKVLPDIGCGIPTSAALANLDGNSSGKLVVATNGIGAAPAFYDGTGTQIGVADQNSFGPTATSQDVPDNVIISHGSFGDIDGDGKLDFVDGTIGFNYTIDGLSGTGNPPGSHAVTAWAAGKAFIAGGVGFTAPVLPGFPALTEDFQFFMNYSIADIDGDGHNEVLSGSGVYLVTAFRADGSQPAGWPKNTGGWTVTTPAVGDIDGDGKIDIVTVTREGWLWAWHGHGLASSKVEWDSFHHDAQNSGNYGVALEKRHGPVVAAAKSGCSSTGGGETWLGLLAALALFRARRRR